MMKAESGRKLQPRCQMSTQGLQQAGSTNTAQRWYFGGWCCGLPTLCPSPPCLASIQLPAQPRQRHNLGREVKSRFKVRTREQGGP